MGEPKSKRKNYCRQRPKSRQRDCAAGLGDGLTEEVHMNCHYSFRSKRHILDLDAIVANLILE